MPSCARVGFVLFAALALAAPAGAASLPFEGTLSIGLVGAPTAVVSGTGVATVNGGGHLSSLAVPGSVFATTFRITPYPISQAPLVGQILTVENDPGTVADGGGTLGGAIPLRGLLRLCVQYGCTAPPFANISIPLSVVGVGGSKSTAFLVPVTVQGAAWTSGVASAYGATAQGFAHGAASGTSSTAGASGVVSLVTPILLSTSIGASATIPGFARMTLHFVPEPAPAGLLLMGCAGLALVGRRLSGRRA